MVGGFLHVISDPIAEGQRLADVETGSFVIGGGVDYYSHVTFAWDEGCEL